jgi:hypothetical protein
MTISLLFPTVTDLSATEVEALAELYKAVCDRLVERYQYSTAQLADALDPMTEDVLRLRPFQKASLDRHAHYPTFSQSTIDALASIEAKRQGHPGKV